MEVGVGAEPFDAPQHGRSGRARCAQALDDRVVQRLTVPLVGLTDVDAHQQRLPFDPHQMALPMSSPAKIAARPRPTDPTRFATARP